MQVGGSLEDDGGAKRSGQREEELALIDLLQVRNAGWRCIGGDHIRDRRNHGQHGRGTGVAAGQIENHHAVRPRLGSLGAVEIEQAVGRAVEVHAVEAPLIPEVGAAGRPAAKVETAVGNDALTLRRIEQRGGGG